MACMGLKIKIKAIGDVKMDFDRAKEEIKARLPEYAAAVLTRSKGKDQYNCPFCGSGTGAKGNKPV